MKYDGNTTVFTNGVFDVLHRKHIELLSFCKDHGDHLVVAIDTDRRVRETKGAGRPVNSEEDRRFVLRSIGFVDDVLIFDSIEELRNLHASIRPDVYVKGGDWNEDYLRDVDGILPSTRIVLFPYNDVYSSTKTIHRMGVK
jgi:D-beta-D-heptose 7-phosphate kinase/D-beta-D-heptose 1-phosphate adenosyltransferase